MNRNGLMPKRSRRSTRDPHADFTSRRGVVFLSRRARAAGGDREARQHRTLFAFIVVNLGVISFATNPDNGARATASVVPLSRSSDPAVRLPGAGPRARDLLRFSAEGRPVPSSTSTPLAPRQGEVVTRPVFRTPYENQRFPARASRGEGRGMSLGESSSISMFLVVERHRAGFSFVIAQASTSSRVQPLKETALARSAARLRLGTGWGAIPRRFPHPRRVGARLDAPDQARYGIGRASATVDRPLSASPAATGQSKMRLPHSGGLRIERTDFVSSSRPAACSRSCTLRARAAHGQAAPAAIPNDVATIGARRLHQDRVSPARYRRVAGGSCCSRNPAPRRSRTRSGTPGAPPSQASRRLAPHRRLLSAAAGRPHLPGLARHRPAADSRATTPNTARSRAARTLLVPLPAGPHHRVVGVAGSIRASGARGEPATRLIGPARALCAKSASNSSPATPISTSGRPVLARGIDLSKRTSPIRAGDRTSSSPKSPRVMRTRRKATMSRASSRRLPRLPCCLRRRRVHRFPPSRWHFYPIRRTCSPQEAP